jgi:ribosomal-protein-alanine N-acetyltransferase
VTPLTAIPTIDTDRLRLRAFRSDDLDAHAAHCADAEVMQYLGAGRPLDRALAWRQMATFVGEWTLHGWGMWAVARRADDRLIGRVGFLFPPGWPEVEIGWLLGRDAWGNGHAREAAAAALRFGRERLAIGAPISLIRPGNLRSIALAERLGARLERTIELMGAPALVYRHTTG